MYLHKIINLRYPTYVYQFLIVLIITKIERWPVFKQDPPLLKGNALMPTGYEDRLRAKYFKETNTWGF